ncbi:ARCA-like protein [Grosmannia clavigera kw1407]|uniref:ARCA-like protein n=1 Tax=Grosmannia clavigera (strain kw1407 / UAMH 11150) TaxID=655863 RepID=F0XNR1_GROCL|nr:ARCA-like protein [Grosmannia clavigera kw1407]EFX00742.1 ARCA-like protein [Grosmannia clavigera kw1407]
MSAKPMVATQERQKRRSRRAINGCENCRLRTCNRKLRTQFRHRWNPSIRSGHNGKATTHALSYSFKPDQPWCRTRRPLTFVNENRELLSLYEDGLSDDEAESAAEAATTTTEEPSGLLSPPENNDVASGSYTAVLAKEPSNLDWLSPISLSQSPSQSSTLIARYNDETASIAAAAAVAAVTTASVTAAAAANAATRPAYAGIGINPLIHPPEEQEQEQHHQMSSRVVPPELPTWPLENKMEACLFRYFIELSAKWFDLCDQERTFAVVVPCRAVLHAPLMNAIFAISARHLSLISSFNRSISDRYYDRCLATLRPMLNDKGALVDENLFAAAVILRNFEEIEAHPSTHLLGNSLFVKASATLHDSAGLSAPILFSGLRRAAFLVAVRQEIYTAFVSQRSICPSFSPFVVDPSLDVEGNDCDWANRAVFHLADVLRFCYGKEQPVPLDDSLCRYDQLVAYSHRWYEKKPLSFLPLYYKDLLADFSTTLNDVGSILFPEIWLTSDTVATGLQHYHLSRILLAAFDPRAPRIGPERAQFAREQDGRIRSEVRNLVGIAKSNPHCRPNFVSACMGIAMAGERFQERWQQESIMGFLEETESLCAWRTHTARERLSAAWGWDNRDGEKN